MLKTILILASSSFALALNLKTGPVLKTVERADVSISVYKNLQIPTSKETLNYTGSGTRKKTILVFPVLVYFLESYSSTKAPLNSKEKILKMTLLRDLSSEDIRKSFSERLKANEVNAETEEFKNIFSQVPEKISKGDTVYFIAEKNKDGSDKVTFQFPQKTFSQSAPSLAANFWKIWFGKTDDDGGLNELKAELQPNS